MPVHRFVLERRVERARVRLMEGRLSRTEIALEAGFTHPSHMARSLRRVLGLSPRKSPRARLPMQAQPRVNVLSYQATIAAPNVDAPGPDQIPAQSRNSHRTRVARRA